MPDISIFTSTQPGAGSGNGYSRNSYRPGSTSVAANTDFELVDIYLRKGASPQRSDPCLTFPVRAAQFLVSNGLVIQSTQFFNAAEYFVYRVGDRVRVLGRAEE